MLVLAASRFIKHSDLVYTRHKKTELEDAFLARK